MKRFGRLLLDPVHVLAVVPMKASGIVAVPVAAPTNYAIHFFNGTMAIVSAEDAAPLIQALAPAEGHAQHG